MQGLKLELLLDAVVAIAVDAGRAILDVYRRQTLQVEYKSDASPLTEADRRANEVITAALLQLTSDIPVLSEESAPESFAQRQDWTNYWLVDPLDGTKEFIKRNGEFTVNIALIEDGIPVLGVVHVPVTTITYSAYRGKASVVGNAWKQCGGSPRIAIGVCRLDPLQQILRVVASRSHSDGRLDQLLDRFAKDFREVRTTSMGSSLKICLVAEGQADIYPRIGPTSEWDTAAAHAVLRAAGGNLVDTGMHELRYNTRPGLLNPDFLAIGDTGFSWQRYFG